MISEVALLSQDRTWTTISHDLRSRIIITRSHLDNKTIKLWVYSYNESIEVLLNHFISRRTYT